MVENQNIIHSKDYHHNYYINHKDKFKTYANKVIYCSTCHKGIKQNNMTYHKRSKEHIHNQNINKKIESEIINYEYLNNRINNLFEQINNNMITV